MCEGEVERGPGCFHIMPQSPLTGMWVAAGQTMPDTVAATWPEAKLEVDAGPQCGQQPTLQRGYITARFNPQFFIGQIKGLVVKD